MSRPYILAHQGGCALAPTNTMAAFAVADTLAGIDFLDIDLHMTRDGALVGIHDNTVDRTTNSSGRIDSYTLAELQRLDAGYHFQDLKGAYSYRGKGVKIPALEEIFSTYAEKYYLHFEIKDTYPKNGPSRIEEKLWSLIQKYHMQQKVIVASFQQEIVQRFQRLAGAEAIVGASSAETTRFVLAQKLHMPALYRPHAQVLELPLRQAGINLKDRQLIDKAHSLGMDISYWTINDQPTMRELIDLGVDGIFTDRPDLLLEVVRETQSR